VDVAVLGVAKYHRVLVAVFGEETGQFRTGGSQGWHGNHNVFQEGIGPGRAGTGNRGVQALAQVPHGSAVLGIVGHRKGDGQGE